MLPYKENKVGKVINQEESGMKMLVVSNMFPDKKHPSYGVFVKHFCEQLEILKIPYTTSTMNKQDRKLDKLFAYLRFYTGTFFKCLFGTYDLVYVHYASHSSIPVLMARKFRKINIFTNVHGSDIVPENPAQEKMQKYTRAILNISNKIIVPSAYFKDYVCGKYGLKAEKVFVSPSGGVNEKVFYKENEKEYGSVLRMGYVGRISYRKGWDTLLMACAKLTIPYALTIVGNGPEYDKLRRIIDEMGISEKIELLDLQPQEKLRELYNNMDVFIFPTEREGESLGLVAIEAMACGTPVIASDFAAPAYYVRDGINGFKYKCGDSKELAERMEEFYALSVETRNAMSLGAISTAHDYAEKEVVKGLKNIIEIT
jgi:glycosyltransferase involved in cell wall biosynthesis